MSHQFHQYPYFTILLMVQKSVSAVDMVNIPFCYEGYFYIPGWPSEPQGWLPPREWNIFAKKTRKLPQNGSANGLTFALRFFPQLFNLMFFKCTIFSAIVPLHSESYCNVASKGIALPKLSDSLFLCWETIWNFVHIADVLGGGGVERDWRGDQYPGSGCGPLGAKKNRLRMDEKTWIQHDDLPLFFFFTKILQTVRSNKHIWSREMPTFQRPHRFIPSPQKAVWLWRVFCG